MPRSKIRQELAAVSQVLDDDRRSFALVYPGEMMPTPAKIWSGLECWADVLVTGPGEPRWGPRVLVAVGRFGVILECLASGGHPADAVL